MVDPRNDIPDARDYELLKAPEEPPPPPQRQNVGLWIAVAGLVAAGLVAAYIVFRGPASRPVSPPPQAAAAAPRVQPLGGAAEPVTVPPLDESDPVVRTLVEQLSSHPAVAAWLATGGLVRNFTVVVTNIAEGATPAVHLRVFRPAATLSVIERGGGVYIDPGSYHRYDSVAAAAASVDPAGAARVYATLKPRIEEAYAQLGAPDGTFDRALERAIAALLATPIGDEPVRVVPRGLGYAFADPDLEALTAAQKQLLRTGPANARAIQSSLRAIALALGIPAERLPPPRPARKG